MSKKGIAYLDQIWSILTLEKNFVIEPQKNFHLLMKGLFKHKSNTLT